MGATLEPFVAVQVRPVVGRSSTDPWDGQIQSRGTDRFRHLVWTPGRRRAQQRTHEDPIAWASHHGITLWGDTEQDWRPAGDKYGESHTQADIWASVRDHRETYVHACHASGKTFTAGGIVCWWMDTFNDGIVITTASSWLQVKRQLWKEVRRLQGRLGLEGEAHQLHWEIREDHYAQGISTNDVNNLRGFHEGRVLMIIDEGSGVDPEVFDAADQVLTGPNDRLLVLTNPVRLASVTAERLRENRGNHLRLTALDCLDWQDEHPEKAVPGLVSWTWLKDVALAQWGMDSVKYRVHVMGLYPESDERYLFPPDLVGAAMDRFADSLEGYAHIDRWGNITPLVRPDQMGIDVADVGRDKTVWAARWGSKAMAIVHEEAVTDHHQHRLRVDEFHTEHNPRIWVWDAGGVGAGTESELQAMDVPVDRYVGSTLPFEELKYNSRRAEAYYTLRDYLRNGGSLPPNQELRRQLQAIEGRLKEKNVDGERYTLYALQPKEQLEKAINGSPDEADACAMAATPPLWSGVRGSYKEHRQG